MMTALHEVVSMLPQYVAQLPSSSHTYHDMGKLASVGGAGCAIPSVCRTDEDVLASDSTHGSDEEASRHVARGMARIATTRSTSCINQR